MQRDDGTSGRVGRGPLGGGEEGRIFGVQIAGSTRTDVFPGIAPGGFPGNELLVGRLAVRAQVKFGVVIRRQPENVIAGARWVEVAGDLPSVVVGIIAGRRDDVPGRRPFEIGKEKDVVRTVRELRVPGQVGNARARDVAE